MKYLSFLCLFCLALPMAAQDAPDNAPLVQFTFGGLRLINGQSVETLPQGWLDFSVAHRFSPIDGVQNFFGLDGTSNFRLGLAYGLTDRLSVGVGRSRLGKRYDSFAKYKLLRQRESGMPLSASLLLGSSISTDPTAPDEVDYLTLPHRLHYLAQVLVARKMGQLSLQLAPTLVHRNLTDYQSEANSVLALGGGLRWQISRRMSLTGEYYHRFNPGQHPQQPARAPVALSWDIETPLHRFQLQFTNAFSLLEPGFLTQTTEQVWDGGVRFGFQISRVFRP